MGRDAEDRKGGGHPEASLHCANLSLLGLTVLGALS